MRTHPYLRAYMAGIVVPTAFLLVIMTIDVYHRFYFEVSSQFVLGTPARQSSVLGYFSASSRTPVPPAVLRKHGRPLPTGPHGRGQVPDTHGAVHGSRDPRLLKLPRLHEGYETIAGDPHRKAAVRRLAHALDLPLRKGRPGRPRTRQI